MKMFYAGQARFGVTMVERNAKEDAPERIVVRRIRKNNFSPIGVIADVIDPGKKYEATGKDTEPSAITISVRSGKASVWRAEVSPVNAVTEEFRAFVRDAFGKWPAIEACHTAQKATQRICETCKKPYDEPVYQEVAEFSIREDRCGFNQFGATFQVPLKDIGIIIAPSYEDVVAIGNGKITDHAVFRGKEVVVKTERDSPLYTFATSFAFDGFEVNFEELPR